MRALAALGVGLLVGAWFACAPSKQQKYTEFKAGDRCRWTDSVGDFECLDAHTMLACDIDAGTFYEVKCLDDAGCWSHLDPPLASQCYGAAVKLGEPCEWHSVYYQSICSEDAGASLGCIAGRWSISETCTPPQRCVITIGEKSVGTAYTYCR